MTVVRSCATIVSSFIDSIIIPKYNVKSSGQEVQHGDYRMTTNVQQRPTDNLINRTPKNSSALTEPPKEEGSTHERRETAPKQRPTAKYRKARAESESHQTRQKQIFGVECASSLVQQKRQNFFVVILACDRQWCVAVICT